MAQELGWTAHSTVDLVKFCSRINIHPIPSAHCKGRGWVRELKSHPYCNNKGDECTCVFREYLSGTPKPPLP